MHTDEPGPVGLGVAAADAADLVVGLTTQGVSAGGRFEPRISRLVQIFEGDQTGWRIGTDPRELAYQVLNLEISVRR